MRDSAQIWCTPDDLNFETLHKRMSFCVENNNIKDNTKIYLSLDLYASLHKSLIQDGYMPQSMSSGITLAKFYGIAGCMEIVPFKRYRNFLFIGDEDELERYIESGVPVEFLSERDVEWINREFENTVLRS